MSARRDAIFALALWQTQGTFPTQALQGSSEYGFALELLGATLRHKASLEWMLHRCVTRMPKGELWAALMLGAAQLLVLPGVAEHAAIAETVEAVKPVGKGAAKFVNAILRRVQREKASLLTALADQPEHLRRDIPKQLWERWLATYGLDATRSFADALATPPRVCIRPLPPHAPPAQCDAHPDDPTGTFIVPHGVRVDQLDGFGEGHFVVQDVATRHAIELLEVAPGLRVLDACASPGGKTVQIAARLFQGEKGGELVANEMSLSRVPKLKDTLARCGYLERVTVMTEDATQLRNGVFDRILLDVPCSNTGVFGRRPDARWTWSKQRLAQLLKTQAALLDAAVERLAPGGKLVYSTCSIEPEEDDDQVHAFLERHPEFALVERRLELPSVTHDGAYAACLARK